VLSGRVVYIDSNNNGRLDGNERRQTTGSNGRYTFAGLKPGTYRLRVVPAGGFDQTKPVKHGSQLVKLGNGQQRSDVDFGLTRNALVTGSAFFDTNRNHRRDRGEGGLSGVTVFADANGNGKLDATEARTLTDGTGNYSLLVAPAKKVQIRVVPAGRTVTAPNGGVYPLALKAGQIVPGKVFGLR